MPSRCFCMSDQQIAIGGWHAVAAALAGTREVFAVYVRDSRTASPALRRVTELASRRNVVLERIAGDALERLLPGVNHQGCVALAAPATPLAEAELDALLATVDKPLILVLDRVQDPHNLGACLRSAAAAGAHVVVVPKKQAVGLTATVRKVSAGGVEVVPLVRVTNLVRTLKHLKDRGVWIVGATGLAQKPIYSIDLTGPLALVMGNEGAGLRRLTAQTCDVLGAIPMAGAITSLNVSVAAGVCLFEAMRQRDG